MPFLFVLFANAYFLEKYLLKKVISMCLLGLCKTDDKIRDMKKSLGKILNNLQNHQATSG